MNRAFIFIKLTCLVFLLFAGCGSQYPSVSGTVSLDGKPASGVNVLFVPVSTKENPFPGPFAEATTDENGRYTLVTRDGSKGATPGMNVVEFYSVELIQNEFQDSSLQDLIGQSENGAKSNSAPKTKKKRSDRMKPYASIEFEVPVDGTSEADFELTQDGAE